MKYRRLLALVIVVTAGCTVSDPSDDDPTNNQATTNNAANSAETNNSATNSGSAPDAGIDMGGDEPDMPPVMFGDIPESIDSTGAEFAGLLPAGEEIRIDLSVFQSDRVTMWLRQVNGTTWDPSINIYQKGESEELVWGNPRGNEDAHIPFMAEELDDGYEFWFTDTYDLVLENRGQSDGEFEFTLECRGGPCAVASGDADVDGDPDSSDECPYYPGSCDNPYAGMSNGDLEDAIREDHAGHVELNYVEARVHMFAWIDNEGGEVEGVYTGDRVRTVEIPESSEMNTEHTWPQSRSGGDAATESDLHHLFATKPDANEERGSLHFGEVSSVSWERGGSKAGGDGTDEVFEPRDEHKGSAARAMFYYAVVYGQDIPSYEESVLRDWHESFPADEDEKRRNQSIANVQRSRNPFVDFPELVGAISDF